uniref:Uncharacterized protein n=1 Tax=Anguilla anguilla TaxID=7936 RepID=A0A0E9RB60_ANGAN
MLYHLAIGPYPFSVSNRSTFFITRQQVLIFCHLATDPNI